MNILYYLEPHPIRNSFTEHVYHSRLLVPLLSGITQGVSPHNYRIFSNHYALDDVSELFPKEALHFVYPKDEECIGIEGFLTEWGPEAIATWLDLVKGDGVVSDFYRKILERIYKTFEFDCVITWSDNGAVNTFCRERNIPVLHFELGATRKPFPESLYIDLAGTNGFAVPASLGADLDNEVLDWGARTWLAAFDSSYNETDVPSKFDAACLLQDTAIQSLLWQKNKTIYVPLQLADDLNCLVHSPYRTPLDFISRNIQQWFNGGFHVIVKAHPAASSRIYNLKKQQEVKNYISKFGNRVTFLDNTSEADNIALMAQSDFVCTVNSSVGFEALLVGGRAILYGEAAFNVNGLFPRSIEEALSDPLIQERYDKIVSFNLQHFYLDKERFNARSLLDVLKFVRIVGKTIDLGSEDYWQEWRTRISYLSVGNVRGGMAPRSVQVDRISSMFELLNKPAARSGSYCYLNELPFIVDQSRFRFHIDNFVVTPVDGALDCELWGWAFSSETGARPLCMFIVKDFKVVACSRVVGDRPDVAAKLKVAGSTKIGVRTKFKTLSEEGEAGFEAWFLDWDGRITICKLTSH
jgi:Capsule polysaccharide biosynthesis protein